MSLHHLKLAIALKLVEDVMLTHRDEPDVMDCMVDLSSVDSSLHDVIDHFETEDISLDGGKAEADAIAFLELIMETSHGNTIDTPEPHGQANADYAHS